MDLSKKIGLTFVLFFSIFIAVANVSAVLQIGSSDDVKGVVIGQSMTSRCTLCSGFGNGTFVPYFGANQSVDLNGKSLSNVETLSANNINVTATATFTDENPFNSIVFQRTFLSSGNFGKLLWKNNSGSTIASINAFSEGEASESLHLNARTVNITQGLIKMAGELGWVMEALNDGDFYIYDPSNFGGGLILGNGFGSIQLASQAFLAKNLTVAGDTNKFSGTVNATYYYGDGSRLTNITTRMNLTNVALLNQSNNFTGTNNFSAVQIYGKLLVAPKTDSNSHVLVNNTSTSNYALTLTGGVNPSMSMVSNDNIRVKMQVLDGNYGILGTETNHALTLYTNNALHLLMTAGGATAFGQSTPYSKWDFNTGNGVTGSSDSGAGFRIYDDTYNNAFIYRNDNHNFGFFNLNPDTSYFVDIVGRTKMTNYTVTGSAEVNRNLTVDTLKKNQTYASNSTNQGMDRCTLVSGTCTIANTQIRLSTNVFCFEQTQGGTIGSIGVSARNSGVNYTITSSNVLDTSVVACILVQQY